MVKVVILYGFKVDVGVSYPAFEFECFLNSVTSFCGKLTRYYSKSKMDAIVLPEGSQTPPATENGTLFPFNKKNRIRKLDDRVVHKGEKTLDHSKKKDDQEMECDQRKQK